MLWIAKDAGEPKKRNLDVKDISEGPPKALMQPFTGDFHVVAGTGPAAASVIVRGDAVSMVEGRIVKAIADEGLLRFEEVEVVRMSGTFGAINFAKRYPPWVKDQLRFVVR